MANQSVNIRQAFIPRDGYYFIDPDYSQIEFRLSAAFAGERGLLKGFLEDADYYSSVYAEMTGGNLTWRDVEKWQRDIGKVLALGQQYGQGDYGLARALGIAVEGSGGAKEIRAQYWSGLAATAAAQEIAIQRALQSGWTQTWFGRRRPLPDLFSPDRRTRGKGIRSVWSTIVQGSAADWIKIAMLRAYRAMKQQNRDCHLILTVHDEILFECSENEPLYEIEAIIREAMEFKIKNLPVNNLDLYPDGFYCPISMAFGYDWGNLFDSIEDTVDKKGKPVPGFRPWCEANGKTPNFDAPRIEVMKTVSFVAQPDKTEHVVIAPRKNVKKKDKTVGEVKGTGGLDPVKAVVLWAKGTPPEDPMPMMMAIPQPLPVESEEAAPLDLDRVRQQELPHVLDRANYVPAAMTEQRASRIEAPTYQFKDTSESAPDLTPTDIDFTTAIRGGGSVEVTGIDENRQEGKVTTVVLPNPFSVSSLEKKAAEAPPEGVSMAMSTEGVHFVGAEPVPAIIGVPALDKKSEPVVSQNDYNYPCLVIRTDEDLTKKKLEFFKKVILKFPGTYWIYLETQGKIIRAGEKYKADPSKQLLTYLKRGLGEKTTHEIYDTNGQQARGKINFV